MEVNVTALIMAVVALITVVLAIFGASWLNQKNIERAIDSLKGELKSENESLKNELRIEIKRIDQRIENSERRFDQRFASIEQRLEKIERQLEAIFKPILPK